MNLDKYKKYSPIILRIGVSLLFLWFGITQLINPESFYGYVPQWIYPHADTMMHEHSFQSFHNLPLTPHIIIMGNGIFETIFGLFLLLGIYTRLSSFLLGIHLFVITLGLGYNDIAIRDFVLTIVTFVVFLNGADKWCLDVRNKKKEK